MQLLHRSQLGTFLNTAGLTGTGVEVGAAAGDFSREVLQTWRGQKLYLVDCWQTQPDADYCDVTNCSATQELNRQKVTALARTDTRVELIRDFTPVAASRFADGSLDFVYLDANHNYPSVRGDLRAWYPKVRPGGLLAGHDYLDGYVGFGPDYQGGTLFGVKTAVDRFASVIGHAVSFTLMDPPHRSWYFRKRMRPWPAKVTLLTAHDAAAAALGSISRPGKEAYCQRHGYTFRCRTEGFDVARPASWSKIHFLLEELGKAEWVFWSDADSLVMNSSVPLTRFWDDSCDLVLPFDRVNGLNAGCFFARSTEWTAEFLRRVYRREDLVHHPWWENAAIMALYEEDPEVRRHVSVVPNKLFNAYVTDGSYESGDFMLHFPGLRDREVLMRNYAAMAE